MNEFALIETYFKTPAHSSDDIVIGIGDDAACINIPADQQLVITTDTLVENVHFLSDWDPYDIAWKALMVNLSDIAAMGAKPRFASLALTLPMVDPHWLLRFSEGLHHGLNLYGVNLIGGDITRGPLCVTLTIHGLICKGKAVSRSNANPQDTIWVSGTLGGAALALNIDQYPKMKADEKEELMDKLLKPKPRIDFAPILQTFATACIDVSDGLSADLEHICEQSLVGVCLYSDAIPVHPLVKKFQQENAPYFALKGGDDYELCFTIPADKEALFIKALQEAKLTAYKIGEIQKDLGFRIVNNDGKVSTFKPQGFKHF